jgi:large subunit ribosomal protein L24
MMNNLRQGDEVQVMAGKDRGKTGKVAKIDTKRNRVFVEGVNLVKKSLKPTQENPAGGFAEVPKSIHRSNVMVVSPKTKKPTRVRIENKDGKRVRVAVACGSQL